MEMVFKVLNGNFTNVFKLLNDRVVSLNSGIQLTDNSVENLKDTFNQFNSTQTFNDRWTDWLSGVRSQNANVADMFEELSKQGASARASVEGVYAAILHGNTRGFANVRAVINTFKTLSPENQQAFAAAVGQTNAQLGNYLGTVNNGTASMKGYTASLVTAKAASIGLQVASTALNMGISAIVGFLLSKGLQAISDYIVTTEEALDLAEESAKAYDDQKDSLEKLKDEYIAIIDSEKNNAEKSRELKEWKEKLADAYDFERKALEKLNTERDEGIKLLDQEIDKANRRTRDIWLGENKNAVEEAIEHIETSKSGSTVGNFNFNVYDETYKTIFGSELRKYIQFYDAQAGIYEVAGENLLEQYENVQNAIAYLGSKTDLTDTEDKLLSKLNKVNNKIEKELDKYKDTYETYYEFQSLNMFEDYSSENPMEENGKDTYLSWKKGLIDSAEGDTKLQHELGVLAEKQFPDYQKYFENLSKATSMFLNSVNSASEGELANQKYNFLIGLSDEDLEIATQIPDLFKNGLDGAAKEIEKFKKAHPITVDTDEAEEEIKTLADISSEASKKISLIKTAMEEMKTSGAISASTFAELSESGIDLNECLDIVNGKFVVNIEKLKDLEKQTYLDEIATDQLRLAELELARAQTKAHGGDTSWFDDEIERLKQDITFKGALAKEIDNAKPDDNSDGGNGNSEKPASITKFEKELAEKQHEINMGRMKEDAAYWDWYESAYKKAYEGQSDYQDDMYKHEEAVYNGRKKLAEDAFEAEKKAFESSVSKHEDNIDRAKDRGYDSDGNYLDTDSRAKYIEGEYDRIITDIQNRINALIADGAEKNKDEIESLEKDLESWQNKKSDFIYDTGKTNFDNRITDLEKQIESAEKDSTDYEGKKLDTSEKYDYIRRNYDEILAEINNRIGEIIESGVEGHEEELEELNEMYEEYTDKRESTYDDEINHEISVLEKLKDKESDRFDEQIKKLEEQKDAVEDSYDDEIKKIDEKIKAIQDENDEKERTNDLEKARQELEKSSQRTRKVYGSNGMVEYRQDDEAIAEAQKNYDNAKKDIEIAELEKQKEELENNKKTEISKYDEMINAVNQQKDSQIQYWDYLIDILEAYLNPDSLESSSELWDRILGDREKVRQEQGQTTVNGQAIDNPNGKTANANEINENINNAIKANTETAESNANAAKANEETAKEKQQEETTSISPEEAEMKFAQTLGQFFMNGLLLANNGMTASSQFMNEQHGEAATAVNTNNAVNNYNNSPITNNTFTIGDILITNPVGNSDDLAKELRMNIPISFQNQIYSNKKK